MSNNNNYWSDDNDNDNELIQDSRITTLNLIAKTMKNLMKF